MIATADPVICTPPPVEFGAPKKFQAWRRGQDQLFWDILDCSTRFSIHCASVGSGKSPAYMTALIASGKRGCVITESKGLQDQLKADFGCVNLFDMRGLGNYTCQALAKGGHLEDLWNKKWGKPTCESGPCSSGLRCDLKEGGCDYFDAYRIAKQSRLVSTNYAYWIAIHRFGKGLGNRFDWVVMDECHQASVQLSSALAVEFTPAEFKEIGATPPKPGAPLLNWRQWARFQETKIAGRLEGFQQSARIGQTDERGMLMLVNDTDIPDATELKLWRKLQLKCGSIAASTDDWITEYAENGNIRLAPAWVHQYAESTLFLGVPRVVMTSATVRPKTAALLGIPDDQVTFKEYPSYFPVDRRPFFWLPTVKLNYKTDYEQMRTWVVRIDQIIQRRLDRKGIVHTISFEKQKFLLAHSRFAGLMLANTKDSGNTREIVKAFREAKAPAILVSPSVGTGFDFPYEAARYQIIGKVPFRDRRGAILKVQSEQDPEYLDYLTAQDLIQMYGRINRADDDYGETWCVDDQIDWFVDRYKRFFPDYFMEAYQRVDSVMDPPPLEAIA